MAKLENSPTKKLKGKKRKHNNAGAEDEVATKSIIVEANIEEIEPEQIKNTHEEGNTKKSKKRKNKEKGEIKEKRSKILPNDDIKSNCEEPDVDDDCHGPSLEELKESEKPENNSAIVTGRQKKKQKHQKLLESQKGHSVEKDKQRNAEYLKKWKHNRECWKFEKLRQISIQQTVFDSDKMDANIWPMALEYLAGSKGAAKDKIIKLSNDVIDEIDKLCENLETDHEKQCNLNSVKYQRARELLQRFD